MKYLQTNLRLRESVFFNNGSSFLRYLFLFILLLLSFTVLAISEQYIFETQEKQSKYEQLVKELRCVTCPNQSIADSNAPVAKAMQEEIIVRVKRDDSVESIRDYLVLHYGNYVLYRPPLNKATYLLWGGPFLMLMFAVAFWVKSHD